MECRKRAIMYVAALSLFFLTAFSSPLLAKKIEDKDIILAVEKYDISVDAPTP